MNSLNNLGWRNLNSMRNYPFTDSSTLSMNSLFLPQTWILDARVYCNNSYEATETPYISKIIKTELLISLVISSSNGEEIGEAKVFLNKTDDSIKIADSKGFTNGCIVIDPNSTALAQALPDGETELVPSVARFLPHVCQYLPGPQVQSINGKHGNIELVAEVGVKLTAVSHESSSSTEHTSTIRIDLIGDPHFTRYNCITGANDQTDDIFELSSRFLKRLKVLHYVKSPSTGQITGPYKSSLKRKKNGSIMLALSTPLSDPSGTTVEIREARPSFRIQVSDNKITLNLAGA